jgi:hypothetical protein
MVCILKRCRQVSDIGVVVSPSCSIVATKKPLPQHSLSASNTFTEPAIPRHILHVVQVNQGIHL